jgi:hypothetical protein
MHGRAWLLFLVGTTCAREVLNSTTDAEITELRAAARTGLRLKYRDQRLREEHAFPRKSAGPEVPGP